MLFDPALSVFGTRHCSSNSHGSITWWQVYRFCPSLKDKDSWHCERKGDKIQKSRSGQSKQKERERLEKALKQKAEEQTRLQALEDEVAALRSKLDSNESDELRSDIEAEIEEKIQLLAQCNESLKEIQSDIDGMDIDEPEDNIAVKPEPQQAPPTLDGSSEAHAGSTENEDPILESDVRHTNDPQLHRENPEETDRSSDEPRQSNDLFVPLGDNVKSKKVPIQTTYKKPTNYYDFELVDLTLDDEDATEDQLFTDSIVILKSQSYTGHIYLNQYGPKECPMAVWSSSAAPQQVEKCTFLKGAPHKNAMATHDDGDDTGKPKYRLLIDKVKMVAWQPKRGGSTIQDLMDSVEDLNPAKKEGNRKYIFPFTTVLVQFQETVGLPLVWISRSDYDKLSSGAKREKARRDRNIYTLARQQVRNYKKWAEQVLGGPLQDISSREKEEMSSSPSKNQLSEQFPAQPRRSQRLEQQNKAGDTLSMTEIMRLQKKLQELENDRMKPQDTQSYGQRGQKASSKKIKVINEVPISRSFRGFAAKWDIEVAPEDWRDLADADFARFQVMAEIFIEEQRDNGRSVVDDMKVFDALGVSDR
ncbi:hypothetical protein N7468_009907 [Penicillium chermesinum]|uniref:Uncharacterized protein n=1 Tax=Penicillium chermesinum TaxID=63820 RepID=A0A9W9NBR1_9EURO|nr:uncharacterized protein N7468_009907 [Penicillium chermesinum]KAJ5216899.1 hypothetical protein N7468_009907 [Penicillium chermesinum]KAJ6171489.1 hypothetical protein N7470_000556 [Penicillium chermesinum]